MDTNELENLKGKNWVATMMSCWLFGCFGAHRFYTGKIGSAWIMVALSITGIFLPVSVIWSLVDGIMIALGKFTHEDGSELYEHINWLGYVYIAVIILAIFGTLIIFSMFAVILAAAISAAPVPPIAP